MFTYCIKHKAFPAERQGITTTSDRILICFLFVSCFAFVRVCLFLRMVGSGGLIQIFCLYGVDLRVLWMTSAATTFKKKQNRIIWTKTKLSIYRSTTKSIGWLIAVRKLKYIVKYLYHQIRLLTNTIGYIEYWCI